MRHCWRIPGILALNIAMLLLPDNRSHRCSTMVVVIIVEEVVVVIVVRRHAVLVEEHKVEEFLLGRNA
jgi:hypothetical protein